MLNWLEFSWTQFKIVIQKCLRKSMIKPSVRNWNKNCAKEKQQQILMNQRWYVVYLSLNLFIYNNATTKMCTNFFSNAYILVCGFMIWPKVNEQSMRKKT